MIRLYFCILTLTFLTAFFSNLYAQSKPGTYNWEPDFANLLKHSHNMALPSWGPYSDQYNGISHVPAQNNGIRFDVLVQPSLYLRNLTPLANVKRETGYHAWQASADLSYFSYRFELEWKDRVFCDVSFSKIDEQSRLIKAEFVNNTASNRSMAVNIFNTISFPYHKRIKPILPDSAKWYNAADYTDFLDSVPNWQHHLVYDGQLRGQSNDDLAASNTAVTLGKNAGEKVVYNVLNNRGISSGVIMVRYKTISAGNASLQLKMNGEFMSNINLPAKKEYSLVELQFKNLGKGTITFSLQILNKAEIKLDGFTILKKKEVPAVQFIEDNINHVPKQLFTGLPNAVILKYDDIDEFYGMVWSDITADKKELFDDQPDQVLAIFNNLTKSDRGAKETIKINGNNKGWFKDIFSAPIILWPKQKTARYAYVVYGKNEKEVIEKIKLFNTTWSNVANIVQNQQSQANQGQYNKAGNPYAFSQQLMRATTLTNLMYPAFAVNQYIKHTTPGKRWSSLYTWDSGFIGLGYSALNTDRALESLNAYTMNAEEQSAFLEHGTPLPVQAYLFNALWNNTQNLEYLKYYYPRLKRYYDFIGGAENSPTRKLKSNLIKTWDIFYNSGGWDDYAAQVFVHQKKIENSVAPVINTAHQIRFAKLLKMAAWQLGYSKDIDQYNADINMYSEALQTHSWDEASGYYAYVRHNEKGDATGLLQYPSGVNFNMGLDGCSPLIAGICTQNQSEKIIKHLFTKGQLWTDQGITTIDQTAPYYNKDGYWNGRVWMAHQWFVWKALFDLNEPEKAIQIAQTALNVWKRETDDTYNCWENFSVETGNGGGWHQFGALSSPVLNWYSAMFEAGTITHGFNVWPIAQKFNNNKDGFKGVFKLFADQSSKTTTLLLCLNDKNSYKATCNGKEIAMHKVLNGLYYIKVKLGTLTTDVFSIDITKTVKTVKK